jgi:rRNA maturation endonuclease Nob1
MPVIESDYCDGADFCISCHKIFFGIKYKFCPYCGKKLKNVYDIKDLN